MNMNTRWMWYRTYKRKGWECRSSKGMSLPATANTPPVPLERWGTRLLSQYRNLPSTSETHSRESICSASSAVRASHRSSPTRQSASTASIPSVDIPRSFAYCPSCLEDSSPNRHSSGLAASEQRDGPRCSLSKLQPPYPTSTAEKRLRIARDPSTPVSQTGWKTGLLHFVPLSKLWQQIGGQLQELLIGNLVIWNAPPPNRHIIADCDHV